MRPSGTSGAYNEGERQRLFEVEESYWWSVSRRALAQELWEAYDGGDGDGATLDVGCGTGGMLKVLAQRNQAYGVDVVSAALGLCMRRGLRRLAQASATALPFRPGTFRLVTAMDVLEHLDDDAAALREIFRVLRPGGLCIATVPAHPALWTTRDVRLQHRRRYLRQGLMARMAGAGLRPLKCSYIHAFYFPILWVVARCRARSGKKAHVATDVACVPRSLNRLFVGLLRVETSVIRRCDLPFGVGLVCVARRPDERVPEGFSPTSAPCQPNTDSAVILRTCIVTAG